MVEAVVTFSFSYIKSSSVVDPLYAFFTRNIGLDFGYYFLFCGSKRKKNFENDVWAMEQLWDMVESLIDQFTV